MAYLITEVDGHTPSTTEDVPTVTFENTSHCFAYTQSKLMMEFLDKWNLTPDFTAARFRMVNRMPLHTHENILSDLFTSPAVLATIKKQQHDDKLLSKLKFTKLNVTVMKMDFFNKLSINSEIITEEGGMVRGCMDEDIDGINIQDKLREMLLNPSSDNANLFSENEKKEFLFHLLRLVCRGGSMMQAETEFKNYKEYTKKLYKDFITVQRGSSSGKIKITSSVYKVESDVDGLFPNASPHNDFFVVIDDRTATIIYKPFAPFW